MNNASTKKMFKKILIANRGEISCRVSRTAHKLGTKTVAVYSDADAHALHVAMADEAVRLGPAPSRESYLCADKIIAAAKATGAEAIHPGYGFLSENAAFAQACADNGIKFIGPSAAAITAMGSKSGAKALMEKAGVPLIPGYHGEEQDAGFLLEQAHKMGFPVLLKASAGGGGKGMRAVHVENEFHEALQAAQREALNAFGDQRMLIEKLLLEPRHVEVQILADAQGNCVYVFDRDCSIQRRHQKVVEEAPAPGLSRELRQAMGEAAVRAAKAIAYEGAGTLEFLVDKSGAFYFMEMNTRLQVEHPVSELISGLDLVEQQLLVASGQPLAFAQDDLQPRGHAIEVRLYAEDPLHEFLPSTGQLRTFSLPEAEGIRVDTGYREGDEVSVHYDPMMAKLIAWGENRTQAAARLCNALEQVRVAGVRHNAAFLARILAHPAFLDAKLTTRFIEEHQSTLLAASDDNLNLLLLAAISRFKENRLARSPWEALAHFRIGAADNSNCKIELKGQLHEVSLTPLSADLYRYQYASQSGECALYMEGNTADLNRDGKRYRYTVSRLPDGLDVFSHGEHYELKTMRRHDGNTAAQNDQHYNAPMNGRIVSVSVQSGSAVKAGDTLLVMEAMKMEHRIRAHHDGLVTAIAVAAGELVSEGQMLAEIEKIVAESRQ
jgi:3-methylcrotonyl-CoA carboxylase alpha subunit